MSALVRLTADLQLISFNPLVEQFLLQNRFVNAVLFSFLQAPSHLASASDKHTGMLI